MLDSWFSKKPITKAEHEVFIDKLPLHPEFKATVTKSFNRFAADQYDETDDGRELKQRDLEIIRDASEVGVMDMLNVSKKNYLPGVANTGGSYQPGGSILKKLYPNEFALHSFLAEAYWAAASSRKHLWVDMHRDDFVLAAAPSVNKKTIKLINGVLDDLNVRYYRNLLRDIALVTGNVVLDNQRNKFGGLLKLNPLLMERVSPHHNNAGVMDGWSYFDGYKPQFLPYDSVDHIKTYSARSMVLGMPALASVIVDIEAALQAAIYNNYVMQKGGLLSVVFRLKNPTDKDGSPMIGDQVSINLADQFTNWLSKKFGGVRNAGQFAFIPNVEGVDVLNKIGEMDSAWTNLDEKTAIKTSVLLGVFPQRNGVVLKSQYENKQTVDDTMSLSMDNHNYYVTSLIDEYLTRVIIKEGMGIDNVMIEATQEYSSTTKTMAEVGEIMAKGGANTVLVDEWRTKVMHWEPLGGDLGSKFLGEVDREAALKKADNSGSNLAKAVGSMKQFMPMYAAQEVLRHRRKYIPFY